MYISYVVMDIHMYAHNYRFKINYINYACLNVATVCIKNYYCKSDSNGQTLTHQNFPLSKIFPLEYIVILQSMYMHIFKHEINFKKGVGINLCRKR